MGGAICKTCQSKITPNINHTTLQNISHYYCSDYTPFYKTLFHEIKYEYAHEALFEFSKLINTKTLAAKFQHFSHWISVPYYPLRSYQRGCKIVDTLFGPLLKSAGLTKIEAIKRTKNTPPLYTLNPENRKKALENCFKIDSAILRQAKGKILLVDDIVTTQTTLSTLVSCLTDHYPIQDIECFSYIKVIKDDSHNIR